MKKIEIKYDSDGDVDVPRRKSNKNSSDIKLDIIHSLETPLDSVGLQVWRGSLLLSDFIIHNRDNIFRNQNIIEIGSGCGLCSILAAASCSNDAIFVTDYDENILRNCARNIKKNENCINSNNKISVRQYDLTLPEDFPLNNTFSWENYLKSPNNKSEFRWKKEDMEELNKITIVIGADIIYDEYITDALFESLSTWMNRNNRVTFYLAMERRINFCLDGKEFRIYSKSHEYFLQHIISNDEVITSKKESNFYGEKIDLNNVPQYSINYERTPELELWKITWIDNK